MISHVHPCDGLWKTDGKRYYIFTIHHFSGYKAYLIQLEKVSLKTLREAITDAWLAEAPIGLTRQYSRDH
jgi:hypothetical protein